MVIAWRSRRAGGNHHNPRPFMEDVRSQTRELCRARAALCWCCAVLCCAALLWCCALLLLRCLALELRWQTVGAGSACQMEPRVRFHSLGFSGAFRTRNAVLILDAERRRAQYPAR
mgnify:CR=1 FL=1